MKLVSVLLLLPLLACLAIGPLSAKLAHAHRVNVYAWPENGQIHVEAKFSNGNPAVDTPLEIYAEPGSELLLSGRTNQQGTFEFPPPQQISFNPNSSLRVVLIASMGHRDEWVMTPEDLAPLRTNTVPSAATKENPVSTPSPDPLPPDASSDRVLCEEEVLQRIVEQALDKKLAPLIHPVKPEQDKIGMAEILGGLGYIVGIIGIVLAFRSRKKEI